MHILIIPSEEYVPLHSPIAGVFQHDQAKLLISNGHKVGALSFNFSLTLLLLFKALLGKRTIKTSKINFSQIIALILKSIFAPLKTSLSFENKDGVNVIRCSGIFRWTRSDNGKNLFSLLKFYGDFSFQVYVKKYGKPDIIHAHNMLFGGLIGHIFSEKYGVPLFLTEHSSEHCYAHLDFFSREHAAKGFRQIKNITAVSPALIKQLRDKYSIAEDKIEWFPNVIPSDFEEEELAVKSIEKDFLFLNVANLIPLKGQLDLIEAFYLVQDKMPTSKLKIVGGGPLEQELKLIVEKYNLQKKVSILGYCNRTEVLDQMKLCNVFVFPSHYETFGVVLIEALAQGKPVIATTCGGPECIVNERNGLLVAPKDAEGLSQALYKMYLDDNNYKAQEIRKDLIERFGNQKFMERVNLTYNKIINDYHH